MASSTTSPQSFPSSSKPPRILACVLCQHRKIRCDRTFPCANCLKANVKCTPSTPAPARKRRRPNHDLQERLARCEELLKEYVAEKPEGPADPPAAAFSTYDEPARHLQPRGKLVSEDGGVRFMDSIVLGTIYDELRAMREIIDSDDYDEPTPDAATPDDNNDLIFGADSPGATTESLWPDSGHVFRLWQIYIDRVNPLTKIIHVPTLQPYVAQATTDCQGLPKNIEALLFSIYLMAVVALTEDECQAILGYPKADALQRFSSGVRLALIRLGFLKCHDLTTLQALVIYLVSLQGRYNRHAAWILNGITIRIAQKMGLHHDGELLGLSPFESEMRRRLWWQIIMVDAKYAILTGLSHSLLPRNWSVQQPQNLNDADLFPSATEPFRGREGPTEMIFCLMSIKIGKFLVESSNFEVVIMLCEAFNGSVDNSPPMQDYRRTVERLGAELLEFIDKYCDPSAGPVHEMAIDVRRDIIQKLTQLITPPTGPLDDVEGEILDHKDNAFRIAIVALEHDERNFKVMGRRGFLWYWQAHFQLDIFVYMAGQLCSRTTGKLVERAWKQVGSVYSHHPELLNVSNKAHHTLARFILKAWSKREQILRDRLGVDPETPSYIKTLRWSMPNDDPRPEPTPPQHMATELLTGAGAQVGVSNPSFDHLLGAYLEQPQLDWQLFDDMPVDGQDPPPFRYSMGPF